MNKKLYVGNLPYSITEDQLRELFAPHGTVESCRIITDKFSGQSKGFGFVEMATEEEAQKAIEAVNGREEGGRAMVVNEARPERPRGDFGGGGGGRGRSGGFGGGGGGGGFGKRRRDTRGGGGGGDRW